MSLPNKHSVETQLIYLSVLCADSEIYHRVQNLVKPELFDRSLRNTAKYIKDHAAEFKAMPRLVQVKAQTGTELEAIEVDQPLTEWFIQGFEEFIKKECLERAIMASADLIESGDTGGIETLVKDALSVGLTRDLGLEYFENPKERLQSLLIKDNVVSTGYRDLDYKLFGGYNRGGLNFVAGASGMGKSFMLQNQSVNFMEAGMHGVYFSMELSAPYCAKRIDSMTTGISTNEILKRIDDVELKLIKFNKNKGSLRIIEMPAQSTAIDLRVALIELQRLYGQKLDYIVVDYLDLMMPGSVKVSVSDQFVKDKYISEELRNLARELNVVLVTASQLNRSAVDAPDIDHSHIAGGISKINTADNVLAITTTRAQREKGEFTMKFIKTRNSNGVGSSITLALNNDTLRLTDSENSLASAALAKRGVLPNLVSAQGAHKAAQQSAQPDLKDKLEKMLQGRKE